MLFIPNRNPIESVNELPSVVKHSRTIILFTIKDLIKNPYEIFLINKSEEVGGTSSSLFVGNRDSMRSRTSFMYRGKVLQDPFIIGADGDMHVNPSVEVEFDSVSNASIMNGCIGYEKEKFSTSFEAAMADMPMRYPSNEILFSPDPRYYTESHQHLAGLRREDWLNTLANIGEQMLSYRTNIGTLVDPDTTIMTCVLDFSDWYEKKYSQESHLKVGIPNRDYENQNLGRYFIDGLMRFVSKVQFAMMIGLVDSMFIMVDPEEGYYISDYKSELNPLYRGINKTHSFRAYAMEIEDAYTELRDYFDFKGRLLLDINKGAFNIKVLRKDVRNGYLKRTRTQSDVVFYDFNNYLSGG